MSGLPSRVAGLRPAHFSLGCKSSSMETTTAAPTLQPPDAALRYGRVEARDIFGGAADERVPALGDPEARLEKTI